MEGKELRTLFLGDLSVHCTERDVQTLFKFCGEIESIKIKRGYTHQHHSVYGFIRFATVESAQMALENLQGTVFLGRPLKLAWAQRNLRQNAVPRDSNEAFRTAQIHFSYISRQIDTIVSESTLRELFGQFGEVQDVAIKKSAIDQFEKVQHGYGFIHYPLTRVGIISALKAIQTVHQLTIGPVTFDSTLGTSLKEVINRDRELWEMWQQGTRLSTSASPPIEAWQPSVPSARAFPQQSPPSVVLPLQPYHHHPPMSLTGMPSSILPAPAQHFASPTAGPSPYDRNAPYPGFSSPAIPFSPPPAAAQGWSAPIVITPNSQHPFPVSAPPPPTLVTVPPIYAPRQPPASGVPPTLSSLQMRYQEPRQDPFWSKPFN